MHQILHFTLQLLTSFQQQYTSPFKWYYNQETSGEILEYGTRGQMVTWVTLTREE
jgi:hypothetical protein